MTQQLLSKVLKAVYSGAIAFLGSLGTSISGTQTISDLHDSQWVWVALTTLVAAGGTFGLAGWQGPRLNGTPPNG